MSRVKTPHLKKLILSISAIGLAFSATPIFAATDLFLNANGNPEIVVCNVLTSLGLGCGGPSPVITQSQNSTQPADQDSSNGSEGTGSLQASIANTVVKRTASDDEVILIKVPAGGDIRPTLGLNTREAIFEIIKGQKHFIPTVDIFFDYGFDLSVVQNATREDIRIFPRTKLVSINGDKNKVYYITEGYMIRLVPNDDVLKSYGDREEDIVVLSKKEFNFYPRNQYIFLENPLAADIFQILDDGTKRYVVPQVVKRLRIIHDQVAPVNKIQFEAYKYGAPIIF